MASRERDLENGGTTSEEDGGDDYVSGDRRERKPVTSVFGGLLSLNGSIKNEYKVNPSSNLAKFCATENVELLIDKSSGDEEMQDNVDLLEMKLKEKRKKTDPRKPPRPPRPPKGPELDAADMKLIREISELADRKRMRIERIKALKKTRAVKSSSSKSSVSAMIITLLFCLVILFQGICSRSSSSVRVQGSPEPAVGKGEGSVSVQYLKNLSSDHEGCAPGSDVSQSGRADLRNLVPRKG